MLEFFSKNPDEIVFWPGAGTIVEKTSNIVRSCSRFTIRRADYAFSNAYLEGNPITLPEIYTILHGGRVSTRDEYHIGQILALTDGSEFLVNCVLDESFDLSNLSLSDAINQRVSAVDSLDPGRRRNNPSFMSDGLNSVSLGDNFGIFYGLPKEDLDWAISNLYTHLNYIDDHFTQALNYAAYMTYIQAYFDGNKRTSRMMMDGYLMQNGYDAIIIPAKSENEYNESLRNMYRERDLSYYCEFLKETYLNTTH